MAVETLASVTNILKEVIEPGIEDQIQSRTKTISRVKKTTDGVVDDVGGKYVRFAIRTGRNHGIGARQENEALPAAQQNLYETGQLNLSYQYGSISLTGQVLGLADTNEQAFANELNNEITGLKEGLAKDSNRQVYGTSIGKLGTTNALGTTTTGVFSDAEAIYFEVGMVFDNYSSADALLDSNLKITNISSTAGTTTVTFSPAAAVAVASGNYFVRQGSRAREIVGFRDIVQNTGTLYNINGATVPSWRASVDDPGSARALSEGIMITMADQIYTNGSNTSVIFCSLGVRRSYFNLLSQLRRVTNTTEFTGGFKGLAFTTDEGDIPVVHDVDCPRNSMYFMNEKQLRVYQLKDWSWMEKDGSMWKQNLSVSGSTVNYHDAYTCFLHKYWQLGTRRRNAHGVIRNIIEG